MKDLVKPALTKLGVWGMMARGYRPALRWSQRVRYAAAVALGVNLAGQLRYLPPDRWRPTIFVRISSITHFMDEFAHRKLVKFVMDGDWDIEATPNLAGLYDVHVGFRTIYEMFVDQKAIDETSQYQQIAHILRETAEPYRHEGNTVYTVEQAVQYLRKYERIYHDMKDNGYKTQAELGDVSALYEVNVCVGRHGEIIYLAHGTHRLAIALILGIECIPVVVRSVHRHWAESCFKEYGGGVLEAIHKGIQEIDSRRLVDAAGTEVLSRC